LKSEVELKPWRYLGSYIARYAIQTNIRLSFAFLLYWIPGL